MLNQHDLQQIEEIVDRKMKIELTPIKTTLKHHEIILELHGERLTSLEEKMDTVLGILARMENQNKIFFDIYRIDKEKWDNHESRIKKLEGKSPFILQDKN